MKKLLILLLLVGASLAPAQVRALLVDANDNPAAIAVDSSGRPTVNINGSVTVTIGANQSINVSQVGGTSTLNGGVAGSLGVGGLAADGSAVAGNPVYVGGETPASNIEPIAVAGGTETAAAVANTGFVASLNYLWSSIGNAAPLANAASLADAGTGLNAAAVHNLLWNGATFDRMKSGALAGFLGITGAIADAGSSTNVNPVVAGMFSTGTTIRALGSASLQADATGGNNVLAIARWGYNGTNFDRLRTAALATYPTSQTTTARNSIGAEVAEKGSRWSVISNPAAGSAASASIASETSVRHVADCVSFAAAATTAPAASTLLTVNLRDGATGAGTIIWTWEVEIPAVANAQEVAPHSICGLNLVGTTATAMTLEFSGSVGNLVESVSISGFNVI